MNKVISSFQQLDFSLSDLEPMPAPEKVIVVHPSQFEVEYVINPHMEGNSGDIDKEAALQEWNELKKAYQKLGKYVHEVEDVKGCPDMVCCANQSLPNITDGRYEEERTR